MHGFVRTFRKWQSTFKVITAELILGGGFLPHGTTLSRNTVRSQAAVRFQVSEMQGKLALTVKRRCQNSRSDLQKKAVWLVSQSENMTGPAVPSMASAPLKSGGFVEFPTLYRSRYPDG